MADGKTTITSDPVEAFIQSVEPSAKRDEARELDALFRRVTGEAPQMWGVSIIGYGEYRTTYDSGREVHSMRTGFSPQKAKHSLYLQGGYSDPAASAARDEALGRLGKHSTGKSCLYLTDLAKIEMAVLEEIVAADWQTMLRLFPER